MELIVACVAKGFILIASMGLYVYLFAAIIPRFIMKLHMVGENTRDRGLKKFVYPNGRCILYETEVSVRRYVSSYALYTEDGYKYIKCKVANDVSSLKYDVYAFDNHNKLIDIIGVIGTVGRECYTEAVSLPADTSYVRFVLRKADNKYTSNRVIADYSILRYSICAGVVAVATAIEAFVVYSMSKNIIASLKTMRSLGLHRLDIDLSSGPAMTAMVIGISLLTAGLTVLAYMINAKRVINR